MGQRIPEKEIVNLNENQTDDGGEICLSPFEIEKFLFEKSRNCKIEEKRNAQFLAYRELCIFANKYF